MTDPVNHPAHYTSGKAKCACGRTIECIDISRHWNFPLGSALKYLWRADLKGSPVQDLEKAIKYIEFEIETRKGAVESRKAVVAEPDALFHWTDGGWVEGVGVVGVGE